MELNDAVQIVVYPDKVFDVQRGSFVYDQTSTLAFRWKHTNGHTFAINPRYLVAAIGGPDVRLDEASEEN